MQQERTSLVPTGYGGGYEGMYGLNRSQQHRHRTAIMNIVDLITAVSDRIEGMRPSFTIYLIHSLSHSYRSQGTKTKWTTLLE